MILSLNKIFKDESTCFAEEWGLASRKLFEVRKHLYCREKNFTYFTKTRAKLTTYSTKPGNYYGTNIFEIDNMKMSSPINLKSLSNLTFSQMFWLFWLLLFQMFSAEHKVSDTEEKCYFGFDSGKKCEF